tara:strand:+ start:1054 stop:1377 length:324 start_codon:yes stop_codon:yes gene_type:complete
MKKIVKVIIPSILIIFLYSCGNSINEAGKVFRNEKIKTTDEFLVKKKDPLNLPPDFREIPKPGSLKNTQSNNEKKNKINKILKIPTEETTSAGSSSVEKSIINKIGK